MRFLGGLGVVVYVFGLGYSFVGETYSVEVEQ